MVMLTGNAASRPSSSHCHVISFVVSGSVTVFLIALHLHLGSKTSEQQVKSSVS
jgi:hypothetical protein